MIQFATRAASQAKPRGGRSLLVFKDVGNLSPKLSQERVGVHGDGDHVEPLLKALSTLFSSHAWRRRDWRSQ